MKDFILLCSYALLARINKKDYLYTYKLNKIVLENYTLNNVMAKQKISVDNLTISLNKDGYISLTDIAKKSSESKPIVLIRRWLRTQKTLSFLFAWEEVHNPNFKVSQKGYFRDLIN